MPTANARRAIDEIAAGSLAPRIAYHLLGEPLLHPDVVEILRHARSRRFLNRVVTNGSTLRTRATREALAFCDQLDISLRAANEDEYGRLSQGGSFPEYLAGIAEFLRLREQLGAQHVRVRMFTGTHVPWLSRQIGLGKSGDALTSVSRGVTVPVDSGLSLFVEPRLDWVRAEGRYPSRFFGRCDEPAKGFAMLANGDVTPCCFDHEGKNALGNFITGGGVASIVLGHEARTFRGNLQQRRIPTELCAGCLARSTRLRSLVYQAGWALLGLPDRLSAAVAHPNESAAQD
jgi:hypothetical protein